MRNLSRKSKKVNDNPFSYSYSLLARRDYSEYELKKKLIEHFEEEAVNGVIEKLKERGLLSDERYMERMINKYAFDKKYGYYKVELELLNKGFDRKLLKAKLNELLPENKEIEIVRSLLGKRPKEKIRAYLINRGFRPHIVKEVLAEID